MPRIRLLICAAALALAAPALAAAPVVAVREMRTISLDKDGINARGQRVPGKPAKVLPYEGKFKLTMVVPRLAPGRSVKWIAWFGNAQPEHGFTEEADLKKYRDEKNPPPTTPLSTIEGFEKRFLGNEVSAFPKAGEKVEPSPEHPGAGYSFHPDSRGHNSSKHPLWMGPVKQGENVLYGLVHQRFVYHLLFRLKKGHFARYSIDDCEKLASMTLPYTILLVEEADGKKKLLSVYRGEMVLVAFPKDKLRAGAGVTVRDLRTVPRQVWSAASALAAEPRAWEPVGLSGGGAMFAPAVSRVAPKLMMINCDMSAAYLSRDGGRSWRMIHHSQLRSNTRCRPAFHPADAKTIYAASGWWGKLAVSRDGGRTWSGIGNLPGGLRGEIAIDPDAPARMLVGVEKEVWRSLDAGKTWKRCAGPRGEAVGFHFDRTSPVAFAATTEGVWRSPDGGETWEEKSGGLPWRGLRSFGGGSNAKEKTCLLYCAIPSRETGGAFGGGVYRSADRGETWEPAMGAGINRDTKKADQWAMGDIAEYYWVLANDARPATVYALNGNTGVKPPHHASVYRSDDAGRSWRVTFTPDPRFGGMNVGYNWQVANLGQHYQERPLGAAVSASNPDVLLHCGSMLCYVTENGGRSWQPGHTQPAPGAPTKGDASRWTCNGLVVTTTWHYYIDPHEPARRYIAYTDIGFARSLDGGKSWNWWGPGRWAPWRNTCYELAFDPETRGRIWGAFSNVHDIPNANIIMGRHRDRGPGGVCVSTDFGATWKESKGGLPESAVTSIALDPTSPKGKRTLWAAVWGHGVYRSSDDGRTWTKKSEGLGAKANMRVCRVVRHAGGTLFALVTAKRQGKRFLAEGAGLYRSRDKGETWERITAEGRFLWPKDFTVDAADSRVVYLGAADAGREKQQGGLYRTTDGGATWTRLARKGREHFGATLHPKRPGWIYMTLCEGPPGAGLWLSKDGGKTWEAFGALPFSNVQRVTFDPADDGVIYATTFGGSVWKGPVAPVGGSGE